MEGGRYLPGPGLAAWVLRCDATSAKGDYTAPLVQAVVSAPVGAPVFVPTDTLEISVTGSDETALASIGYDLGYPAGLRDSVSVADTGAQHTFRIAIRGEWEGIPITVTAFAHDAFGNTRTLVLRSI